MNEECPHGIVGDGSCPECSVKNIVRTPVAAPNYVGLDMSLSSTGFCCKEGSTLTVDTIKTTPRTCANDLARLRHICSEVMKRIPQNTRMICIEDYFTPSNRGQIGSALKLVALGTITRMALFEAGFPFYVVAPGTLKKFITGKGNAQKSMIIKEVYKRYGVECGDDNQADAYGLMLLAEGLAGCPDDYPKFQVECVDKLLSDGKSYNVLEKVES